MVYRELAELGPPLPGTPLIVTVSVDEKPGVQVVATTSPDRPPVPGEQPEVGRDYEHRQLGTAAILAALDLPLIIRPRRRLMSEMTRPPALIHVNATKDWK